MNELQSKIDGYREEIGKLQAAIVEQEKIGDMWSRINIVEMNDRIRDLKDRIVRLQQRIDGTLPQGPTVDQIRIADWVLSQEYDNQ